MEELADPGESGVNYKNNVLTAIRLFGTFFRIGFRSSSGAARYRLGLIFLTVGKGSAYLSGAAAGIPVGGFMRRAADEATRDSTR